MYVAREYDSPMRDLNELTLPELYERLAKSGLIRRLFELAYAEDLGGEPGSPDAGDVTSELCVDRSDRCEGTVVARGAGVVCGLAAVGDLLDVFAGSAVFRASAKDGERVAAGQSLGKIMGSKRDVLAVERTLLNVLGRLSGVATATAQYASALGTGAKTMLYDTRKTTPGLRALEKYAVRCGGGMTHRMGLYDAVMVKDNHLASVSDDDLADFLGEMVREVWPMRAKSRLRFVEVEVDGLEQFKRLVGLEQGAIDIVLLDNMSVKDVKEAVRLRDDLRLPVQLEASGGITLENIAEYAATGVDRISTGAMTHHSVWLDVALDLTS